MVEGPLILSMLCGAFAVRGCRGQRARAVAIYGAGERWEYWLAPSRR